MATFVAGGASAGVGDNLASPVEDGSRCSWTEANLKRENGVGCWVPGEFFLFQKKLVSVSGYLLRVTKVPVNFLHLRNAFSSLSGSSLMNFSSRQTLSISAVSRPLMPSWRPGNLTLNETRNHVAYSSGPFVPRQLLNYSYGYLQVRDCFAWFWQDHCHVLDVWHVNPSLPIYHIASKFFDGTLQFSKMVKKITINTRSCTLVFLG